MADFGSPVAAGVNVNPNQSIQTLSGLLQLKSQKLGLQGQAAEVQQQQQTARQRAGIANVMQAFDPAQHVGPDGTLDLDGVLTDPKLRQAAGDQFPELMSKFIGIKQQQLTAKQQLSTLNADVVNQYRSALGGLRTDPDVIEDNAEGRRKVQEAIGQLSATGPDGARVGNIYGAALEHVPAGKLSQAVSNFQLQAMDASAQASHQAPNLVDSGATIGNVNPQAAGGPLSGQPPITKTVPPGPQVFTDQYGRVFNFNPQTKEFTPANPQGSGGNGPGAAAPGDVQSLTNQVNQNFSNVTANRTSASLAPQQLDQIHKALELSKATSTGAGSEQRARWESGLAAVIPGFNPAANDATKLQLLDKFSERIAADSARVLGANASTDAARDSIHRQNANIGYTPQAVQSVLKYAEAQTLAMQAKGDAQEKWLKQQGNGIANQHEFETAWRQSYDPVLFQLEAADPAERLKIIQGLSKEEAASLAGKRQKLIELGAMR